MKQIFIKSAALLLLSGLLFFSCKKDAEQPDLDTNTTSDNANSQSSFDDMAKVSEEALTGNNSGAKMSSPGFPISCATVDSIVINSNSKQFTLNFTGGGTCNDGKVRSGQITAILTGASYNTPGAVLTLTTSNYTINGNKIEGKKVITCVDTINNIPIHNIVVSDAAGTGYAKITYANGEIASWKSKRTRTLISGAGDANITNNIYNITATTGVGNPVAEGINRNGKSYTVDIVSAIRIDFNCFANNTARYPTQGVLKLTPEGKIARSIDYGDGTCDNKVQVIIAGKTYDITLVY